MNRFFLFIILGFLVACKGKTTDPANPGEVVVPADNDMISYTVKKYFPHDKDAFTEGLLFHEGRLYESTGASLDQLPQTRSLFGVVDTTNGKIEVKAELDKFKFFGEGITFLNGKAYQLTYKNQLCFVYDLKTFKQIAAHTYENKEGWGMTTDGKVLIMSDGTNRLTFRDPESFKTIKTIDVLDKNVEMTGLNELEYIKGYIYANVWQTSLIVKIDPATGKIVGKLNLINLVEYAQKINPYSLELNGIAYDETSDRVVVTGKMWPHFVEIVFAH